jgi:glycosyltransferase involved in cell wall biosynthesis
MSKPRIYIATHTFLPMLGGAEKQALAHACSLHERGFATTIVTMRFDKNWAAYEIIEGVPVHRVAEALLARREKLPGAFRSLLYLLAVLVMSWTFWRHRRHYDIIHLYHLSLETFFFAPLCCLLNKRLVVSVRCADAGRHAEQLNKKRLLTGSLDPNEAWLHVDEREQQEGDLVGLAVLGRHAMHFTQTQLQRIGAIIVILSSRMWEYLAIYDFTRPEIQLIPNGVDTRHFHPVVPHQLVPDREQGIQTVICVAKFRYQKGLDTLLHAWYIVHKQVPGAQLVLVGNGPLQQQLERMVEALGLKGSVEFRGEQHDVVAQLHQADLSVLSSYWEGMPTALLEAMACALPCVATRVSGSEDIIKHEVDGLLVEPADYEGLAQSLLRLIRNPALARHYGQAAHETIQKHYSLEHITDRYVELYERLAARKVQSSSLSSQHTILTSSSKTQQETDICAE